LKRAISEAANSNSALEMPPCVAKLPIRMNSGITAQVVAGEAGEGLRVEEVGQRQPAGLVTRSPPPPATNIATAMGTRSAISASITSRISSVASWMRAHGAALAGRWKPCTACPARSPPSAPAAAPCRRRPSTRAGPSSSMPDLDSQAFRPHPPPCARSAAHRPGPAAARQSGPARAGWRQAGRAVKKSTMMLPRWNWHQGRNSAMAAPATTPVNLEVADDGPAHGVAADQADAGHQRDHGQQHAGQHGAGLCQFFKDAQAGLLFI
jgi:hypothetical protein